MIHGIDVSNWNSIQDVEKKLKGCGFCFIKVSEGTTFVDKKAADFLKLCDANGVAPFLYHFCHFPNDNYLLEVNHFLDCVRDLLNETGYNKPVGLCLDVEADAIDHPEAVANALNLIYIQTRATPLVYGSMYNLKTIGQYVNTKLFGLWVARWLTSPEYKSVPLRIEPWKTVAFWQYWGAGYIDLDVFFGDYEQLSAYQNYVKHLGNDVDNGCCENCAKCRRDVCYYGMDK